MKRILFFVALVLGVVSCQNDPEGFGANVGGEQEVIVNVSLPEETRANSAVGAVSNVDLTGDYTIRYIFQVYNSDFTESKDQQVKYSDDASVSFPVRLVPGRNYNFVVWADIVENANPVDGEKCDDWHYDTANLKAITLKGDWNAMDETRDAYTVSQPINNFKGTEGYTLTLKRPFAKLRVITTDMAELLGLELENATVTYVTKHYNTFNALQSKAVSDSKNRDIKHENYTIKDYETTDGKVLFTDYFFAENDVVKFNMSVAMSDGKTVDRSFTTDIHVKRNHLTTLIGDILTEGNNITVKVEEGFAGESGIEDGKTFAKVDTAEELLDAINKGVENITLEGDIDLSDLAAGTLSTRAGEAKGITIGANKVITLNLADYTITGLREAKDANGNRIHTIVNNGDLTVNGGTIKSVAENGGSAICNNAGANLTINNVEINGAPLVDGGWPSYGINNYGTMTINGAKVNTYHGGIATGGNGIAIIEDATVDVGLNTQTKQTSWALYVFDNGQMTVNGGTFKNTKNENGQVYGGGYICAISTSKTIINGGTFDKTEGDNNGTGLYYQCKNLEIKGGTFDVDPSKYVVPGYKAEEENGVYVVRKPQALIDFENDIANGNDVTLSEDLTLIDPVTVPEGKEVTINLNGQTLDIYTHKSAGAVLKNNGTLAIEGGTISSLGNNGGSAIANNGTLTVKNATLNGAPNADGSWPAYTVNNTGTMTLENSTITSKHGSVASYGEGAVLTLNNCTIDMAGIAGFTSHGIYTYNGGKVIINGGTYKNNATDQNSTGASVINGNVEVNAGTFTGRIENYYGTPVLKGGTYSVKPNNAFVAEGYKVIEENGKYNVVLDEVDDVVSSTETLEEAIAAGSDTIALSAGEYIIPDSAGGKTIAFVGTGAPEDTLITAQNDGAAEGNCDYSLRGSKATFENVTITTTGTYFPGYAGCQGTYKNCIINGVFTLYDNSSFENCTFNISGDLYNVWTWGAAEATFTNCTFNCDGKAMLLYGTANTKLTMNNCVFNDKGSISGKAAIETGNDYGKSYELTVNNATVNGFDINPNGFVTGTTLWANKNSMPASKLKVTVDGKNAYNYVAAADNTTSFTQAITNGATEVTLSAGNYTMPEPELRGKALTITGTKDVVIDATAVDARDQFVTGATMVFDGVTINFGNVNYMGFANTASLTYKNCKINGLQFLFGENVTFENCELDSNGAEHTVWTYGCKNVTFTECDFTYGDRCVNCYSDNDVPGGQTVNFTECTFATANTASAGAVEINSFFITNGIVVNLEGCTAPAYGELAYVSPWDSNNGAKTTINIK